MQTVKRKLHYVRSYPFIDWVIAIGLVTLGLAAIIFTFAHEATSIGTLASGTNHVRFRRFRSSTWQDYTRSTVLQTGDEVSTEAESFAEIRVEPQTVIHLFDFSHMGFHLEKLQLSRSRVVLDLLNGKANLELNQSDEPVELLSQGNRIYLKVKKPNATAKVQVILNPESKTLTLSPTATIQASLKPRGVAQTLDLTPQYSWVLSLSNSQISKSNSRIQDFPHLSHLPLPHSSIQPVIPTIVSPNHGTLFISSTNELEKVTLKWESLPDPLQPEVDVQRIDDPNFHIAHQDTKTGTILNLPDGSYEWRIRSRSQHHFSEWSHKRSFIVKEHPRGVFLSSLHEEETQIESVHTQKIGTSQHSEKKAPPLTTHNLRSTSSPVHAHALKSKPVVTKPRQTDSTNLLKYAPIVEAAKDRIEELTKDPNSFNIQILAPSTNSDHPAQAPLNVKLKWNSIGHAEMYEIDIFLRDKKFLSERTTSLEYTFRVPSSELPETYSYQINTRTGDGKTVSSPRTPVSIPISRPTMIQPPSYSDHTVSKPILFSWMSDTLSGEYYEIQISSDAEFKNLIYTGELQEKKTMIPVDQTGAYFWRIKSKAHRFSSHWSVPRKFYVR
jgi:hypothetical protein